MKVLAAVLLRFFVFRLRDEAASVSYRATITLLIEDGLHLTATPRCATVSPCARPRNYSYSVALLTRNVVADGQGAGGSVMVCRCRGDAAVFDARGACSDRWGCLTGTI